MSVRNLDQHHDCEQADTEDRESARPAEEREHGLTSACGGCSRCKFLEHRSQVRAP